ncbi:MAG TPA: ribosome biogenesis factor YjgA [Casimicrobiaceae bacterium]|nr:ribosome biogenesis factor YjgA [Casimicrobiaceae bacterium]
MRSVHDPDTPSPAIPSKTRRKKDMLALQTLGEALVDLEPARLAALELPERLFEAISQARTITKHEAKRRQLQYVGRLMRDVDPEPIRAALEHEGALSQKERARFAAAERWRERMLVEEAAVGEFLLAYPHADEANLRELIASARSERASGRAPHAFRALFRLIVSCSDQR